MIAVKKDGLDERTAGGTNWTRVDDYVVALARRRTARHQRERRRDGGRFELDGPTPTLGTIPFLVMMAAFALLVIAIAGMAWPQKHDQPKPAKPEIGTAQPGWLEKAEREMNKSQ